MDATWSSDHLAIYHNLHLRLAITNDVSLAMGIIRIDQKGILMQLGHQSNLYDLMHKQESHSRYKDKQNSRTVVRYTGGLSWLQQYLHSWHLALVDHHTPFRISHFGSTETRSSKCISMRWDQNVQCMRCKCIWCVNKNNLSISTLTSYFTNLLPSFSNY
jgi:hypothetical protein